MKRGDEIPDKIANPPILTDIEGAVYTTFLELSSCRLYTSAGVGPIPWTAIYQYMRANELMPVFSFYMSCIRQMDSTFLKHAAEKMKPDK